MKRDRKYQAKLEIGKGVAHIMREHAITVYNNIYRNGMRTIKMYRRNDKIDAAVRRRVGEYIATPEVAKLMKKHKFTTMWDYTFVNDFFARGGDAMIFKIKG